MSDCHRQDCHSLLRLLSRAQRLEAFPRTGWQVCGVQHPESVAAHSYGVALVAMWLGDHMDRDVDTARLLRIALVHDFTEAMLTDLPRPVKQLLGDDAVGGAEDRAAEHLFDPELPQWHNAHRAYREASTLEARLVKAADRIQMLAKALQYRAEQRGRVDRFFEDRDKYDDYGIELVAHIYDLLFEMHANDEWFEPGYE